MAESTLAIPACVGFRRTEELEQRLLRVVGLRPGVRVTDAATRVRQEVAVRRDAAYDMIRVLVERGVLWRRSWGRHDHLFIPCRDLDAWWVQLLALRDPDLRRLHALIRDEAESRSGVCHRARTRFGWGESTTRYRIWRLQDAGLVAPCRAGKRDELLKARPIHPSAQETMNQNSTNWFTDVGSLGTGD